MKILKAKYFALFSNIAAPLILIGAFLLCQKKNIDFSILTRDIMAKGDFPVYFGIFSNIGVFLWIATGSFLLFASFLMYHTKAAKRASYFLFFSALFSLMLGLDDFFLLHEKIIPRFLGVPEFAVFAFYGISALFYFYKFHAFLLNPAKFILASSVGFLAFMVLADVSQSILVKYEVLEQQGLRSLLEDGSKLLGIINWVIYYWVTAFWILLAEISPAPVKD